MIEDVGAGSLRCNEFLDRWFEVINTENLGQLKVLDYVGNCAARSDTCEV